MTKKRKWTLIVGSILLLCLTLFTSCSKKHTLDFKQMVDIEFSGLNGKGKLELVDNNSMYENKEFLEALFPDNSTKKAKEKLKELMNTVNYSFSKQTDLSNDDEIIIKVEYDKDLFEDKEVKVENSEYKLKVTGLSDGTKIDVFDGLQMVGIGYSGFGDVSFNNIDCNEFVKENVTFLCSESNLSNGDKVKVVASFSEELAEKELLIIENVEKEFTVSGLKEPVKIDPFENLNITYTGASPYLNISLDNTKCDNIIKEHVVFSIDKDENIKNGDEITITTNYKIETLKKMGYILKQDTKTYKVENQPEYITSLEGFDTKELQSEINDKLAVVTAANEGDWYFAGVSIMSFKSIADKSLNKTYLLTLKPNFEDEFIYDDKVYNKYVQIYEYTINKDNNDTQVKAYVAIFVDNIIKSEDGTLIWDFELWDRGYDNLDSLINDYVISEKEYYNVSEIKEN